MLNLSISITLILLAAIHFNWVFGGTWGYESAIPTKENGDKLITPRKIETAVVGIVLTVMALLFLHNSKLVALPFPDWATKYGSWVIPILFILRAIGDFKYIGFFKKIKNTQFGKADTQLFIPLCLGIGILGIMIQVFSLT